MKEFKNSNNEWFAFDDDNFDELGNVTNEIVKNIIEKENLIQDEEGYLIYLESIKNENETILIEQNKLDEARKITEFYEMAEKIGVKFEWSI